MAGIEKEMLTFIVAVLSGAGARILYRCLECARDIFRHSLIVIGIEDVFFWVGMAFYLFVQIYQTSNGSIRWYFALGVVLGALLATFFLRKIEKCRKKFYRKKKIKSEKNVADTCEKE